MSQEAEVRLKLVIDASGARVIDQITGATVKTVNAEKEHAEKIAQSRAAMEALRKEAETLSRTVAQGGLGGGGSLGMGGTGGLPQTNRFPQFTRPGPGNWPTMASTTFNTPLNQSQWPSMVGSGEDGGGSRPPSPGPAADAPWLSAGMKVTAFVAAATVAVKTAGDFAAATNEILANPYTSYATKQQQFSRSIPIGGAVYGAYQDLKDNFSDRPFEIADLIKKTAYQDYKQAAHLEAMQMRNTSPSGYGELRSSDLRHPITLPRSARETVASARSYQEQQQVLPTRERAEAQRVAALAANFEAQFAAQRKRVIGEELRQLNTFDVPNKQRALQASMDADEGGKESPRTMEIRQGLKRDLDQVAELTRQSLGLTQMERGSRLEELKAKMAARSATIGPEFYQSQLAVLEGRQAESQQQARSLGMAGPQARYQSAAALQMIQQAGIENAAPEQIQQAAQLFPKTIGMMAEKAGQEFQKAFQDIAPEEYANPFSEIKKEVDQTRQKLADSIVQATREMAQGQAAILKAFLEDMIAHLLAQQAAEFRKIEVQKMIEANK